MLVVLITFIAAFFMVFVNKDFYDKSFAKYGTYQELGVEGPRGIVDYLINYLTSENTKTNETAKLDLFTDNERAHLKDVQGRIVFLKYFGIISVIFLLVAMLRLSGFQDSDKIIRRVFIYATVAVFSLCLIIFLLSLNFPSFFDAFHRILFPAGNYTFPGDSLLITLFPEGFFLDFARKLLVETLIISLMFLVLGAAPALAFRKPRRDNKS